MRMQAAQDMWNVIARSGALNVTRAPGPDLVPHDVARRALAADVSPVQAWREYLGLTEAQVASRLGVTQQVYARWEASRRMRRATRDKIADALSITPAQLEF
jgi:DNA-binding transcriptional regulator YiaG